MSLVGSGLILPVTSVPFLDVNGVRDVGARSAVALKALGSGTSPAVAIGSTGYDTTSKRTVECTGVTASTSTWIYRELAFHRAEWSHPDAALTYMPWTGTSPQTNSASGNVSFDAPYAGRCLRVTLNENTGTLAGVTTVGFHFGAAGAAPGAAAETQQVDITALDTDYMFNFTAATAFAAGARIAVSFDPTANVVGGFLHAVLVLEYDIPI